MKSWLKIFGEILIVTVSLTPIIRADDEALLKSSRQIYCPLICESPGIDGKLDVPCWRNAENFGLFMVAGQTIPAAGQTSGKIFYDGTNLYLGVKCAGTGAPFFSCRERDSNEIWQDEVVEVFIQPGKDYNDYYHFAVNRAGTIYDSHVSPGGHDAKWNSHLQAAVFTGTNGWSVELRLPLADITPVPVNGAEWRFNVCRQSFSPLQERELSTWTYLSAETFNTPQSFGFLYFRTPDDNYRKGGEAFAKSFVKQKPHSVSQGQGPEINDNPAAGISPLAFSNIIGAISSRHPRLFINETMLSSIKTNMTASRRKLLSELQRDVDAYPLKPEIDTNDLPSDIMHRSRNDRGEQAADAALVYLLTGEKKYSEKAFNLLKKSVDYYTLQYSNNRPVSWVSTSRIGALCAFDWLYNAMSEEQRKTVGAPLLEHILQTQDTKKRPKDDGPSGPTAGFYGTPNLPWYAGIAFVKTGLNDEAALKLLEKGYSDHLKMFTFRSQATGDDGGSATPCVAYAGVGEYQRQECIFFHTWRAVMGTDFAGYFPKLAFFPNWLLWNAIPGDRLMYANCFFEFGFGDTWHLNNNTWNPSENYLGQYIYFYKQMVPEMTQIAEYLLAKMGGSDQSIYSSYDYNSVIPFLFMPNTANPAVVAFPEGIPRTRHFENLGQIFMNSGWKPDSTFCLFTAGSTRAGHKHCDENNFVIYRSGFLALDSGTREDNENYFMHQNEYYYRTIAHNCMLIRMKDEVFPVGFTYFYYPQSHNNDGGMSHTTGSKLLAFETSDYYTYVASDAAPAYNADKCDLALRQFIFVYPDYFVVCDRVVSKKPDQLKTWLLHTQNEPVLDGDTFSAGHWGGKLYCRTLLPRKYERKKIGGAGKEFWSDGRNWPIDPQRDFSGFGIDFSITNEAIAEIARRAIDEQTGARGLMTVLERVFRNYKFQLPSTAIKSFEAAYETILDPEVALKKLLHANRDSQRGLLRNEIAEFIRRFRETHNLELVFNDDAIDFLVEMSVEHDKSAKAICEQKFKDFQHGLKIIAGNTGQNSFVITRQVVENPDKELSIWIVASFKNTEGTKRK